MAKRTTNDSSNISEISTKFQEQNNIRVLELEKMVISLNLTIDTLLKEIENKKAEISHLQDLLARGVPIVGKATILDLTDEEIISNMQLQKLKDKALMNELSLEEIKKFDLLVKNKRLAQGVSTINVSEYKKLPPDLSKADLIQIASQSLPEDNSDGENN